MWKYSDDKTDPIITAEANISSISKDFSSIKLPETAVLFYMHSGEQYVLENYETIELHPKFPRFLRACPIYQLTGYNQLCFLDGGRGAPQAVDTLETLAASGVKKVVTMGMFGAFGPDVDLGDILIPNRAFVEEGTSLHYYENIDFALPDKMLYDRAVAAIPNAKTMPIVSTDAVYRQTFYKEQLWRDKGAVGVDMETSALFSVGRYLGVKVVSILIGSDKHPMKPGDDQWSWAMTKEYREKLFEVCMKFAREL